MISLEFNKTHEELLLETLFSLLEDIELSEDQKEVLITMIIDNMKDES